MDVVPTFPKIDQMCIDQMSSVCRSLTKTACCSRCLSWPAWPSSRSSCYATFSLASTSLSSSTMTPGSSYSCCSSPSLTDTWRACACVSAQSEMMSEADISSKKTTGGLRGFRLNWHFLSFHAGTFCPTRQKQPEPSWPSSCRWVWPWEQVCHSSSEPWFEQEASPSGLPSLRRSLEFGYYELAGQQEILLTSDG